MQFVVSKEAKVLGVIVAVLLLGIHRLGGPFWYYAPATTAQVIDEDTGQPLAGATVLAVWRLYALGIDVSGKSVSVREAATGKDGRFTMPRWGPKLRSPGSWLAEREPEIYIYKPGYQTRRVNNWDLDEKSLGYGGRMQRRSNVASLWNSHVIPIPRAHTQKEGEASRKQFEFYFEGAARKLFDDRQKRFPLSAGVLNEEPAWFSNPGALVPIKPAKPVKDPLEGVIFGANSSPPATSTTSRQ